MADRLELAKQYVQEMLEQRDDIVGAFVVGSVARGDADDSSDIDLQLIVAEAEGEELQREGIDTWRDGVYIEAALAPKAKYADPERVLKDRFVSTHLNDALILYDPAGFLTKVQKGVRAVFMEPRHIGARVHAALTSLRENMAGLRATADAGDRLGVCRYVMRLSFFSLPIVPLFVNGITPSSTRSMIQLERVSPELKDRICAWLGSAVLDPDEVQALLPIVQECMSLGGAEYMAGMGDLPRYLAKKTTWMADNGLYCEALEGVWGSVGVVASLARTSDDAQLASDTERLVQDWMRAVGWEGQEVLEEKVRMAEEMVAEVEAMAAHLPVDQD